MALSYHDLTEEQWDLLHQAMNEKAKKHRSVAKRTRNSGYGSVDTLEKADNHERIAEECENILNIISQNII